MMSEAWLEQVVVGEKHVLTYFVVSLGCKFTKGLTPTQQLSAQLAAKGNIHVAIHGLDCAVQYVPQDRTEYKTIQYIF